ncbi:MAG: hypothetical protein P8R42_10440 [Candidatus Binatia bacterium]|nr:hypothetical protein [Candidatus Binatia bacterium]
MSAPRHVDGGLQRAVCRFGRCLALGLALAGCAARFPVPPDTVPAGPTAAEILGRSIQASGGDPYSSIHDIAVRYRGEWGSVVQMLQPVLTDGEYRGESEERLLLGEDVIAQRHLGPSGEKTVLRGRGEIYVTYDGVPSTDRAVLESSALVADAYGLFLVGPAWLNRRGTEWTRLADEVEDDQTRLRILGHLRPGIGLSDADRVVAWIDAETFLLRRVHFTLEGFEGTLGAHADVTFFDYREIEGRQWPTRFIERVRSPVDIHAHLWTLEGLDVDRGLKRADLGTREDPTWSPTAARPATAR